MGNNNTLSQIKWNIQESDKFHEKPALLAGIISKTEQTLILGVKNSPNSAKIWRCDLTYFKRVHDDGQFTFEIPLSEISGVFLFEKESNKKIYCDNIQFKEKINISIVKLILKDTGETIPVLYHSDFDYARSISEKIARTCRVPIHEKIFDKTMTRAFSFIDTPYHQLMSISEKFHITDDWSYNIQYDTFSKNYIEWYSPYYFTSNLKSISLKYIAAFIALFGVVSDLALYSTFASSFLICFLLIFMIPYYKRRRWISVTEKGLSYGEDNFINSYEQFMPFDQIEEIITINRNNFFDFSNYFFSDISPADYSHIKITGDRGTLKIFEDSKSIMMLTDLINIFIFRATHKNNQFDIKLKDAQKISRKKTAGKAVFKSLLNLSFVIGISLIVLALCKDYYTFLKSGILTIYFSFSFVFLFPPAGSVSWKRLFRFSGMLLFLLFLSITLL
jgi:hypothetical protein